MNDEARNDAEHPEPHLEIVFATSEVDEIPVIKSILDGAEIPYVTDGESMMDLFPSDLLGAALHRPKGEMRFMVPSEHVETVKALLTAVPRGTTSRAAAEAEAEAAARAAEGGDGDGGDGGA